MARLLFFVDKSLYFLYRSLTITNILPSSTDRSQSFIDYSLSSRGRLYIFYVWVIVLFTYRLLSSTDRTVFSTDSLLAQNKGHCIKKGLCLRGKFSIFYRHV